MMVAKVRGRFTDFTADIVDRRRSGAVAVEATVQMASIDTDDEGRDDHLRTNDFFDIETPPDDDVPLDERRAGRRRRIELHGDLTIRGVTKPVTFDLEVGGVGTDPWGNTKAGFSATTTINRKDFGIDWNAPLETGGVLVGDKVTIEIDIEANAGS